MNLFMYWLQKWGHSHQFLKVEKQHEKCIKRTADNFRLVVKQEGVAFKNRKIMITIFWKQPQSPQSCLSHYISKMPSRYFFIQGGGGGDAEIMWPHSFQVISHHQWLTLSACVLMWGPSLVERLLTKWNIYKAPLPVSVFLFLLGHTHNLLRSVLHAVFAQQIHSITWKGNQLDFNQG